MHADSRTATRRWWTAVIYLAAAAMFVRFYDLPLKPLHHDEGVNTLFLTTLVNAHSYRYDPGNYHGPTLYYLGWMFAALLGLTTVAIRAVTAAAGLAAVMIVLALRREIGAVGTLVAASLLALSPGAVYFSRYFIHEMPLVCFTIATVAAAVWWLKTGRPVYLYVASVSAGLMFATKETALISAVVLVAAAVGAPIVEGLRSGRIRDAFAWVEALRRRPLARPIAAAVAIFLAVNLLFYTSFLTNWHGALDALKSFAIWTHTGTSAHTRPWPTYFQWLRSEELPILVLGTGGVLVALWRADNHFAIFNALWAAGILTAYSAIPYKTPWLALNALVPLAIAAGYLACVAWHGERLSKPILVIAGAALAGGIGYQSFRLSFVEYDDGRHPYVYVHTSREIFGLIGEIERIEALNHGATIAITSPDHFPLSWYLRAYGPGYYGRATVTNDPIVIASEEQQATLDSALGRGYSRMGSFQLRPGVQLVLYLRNDLQRPSTPRNPE